MKPFNLEEYLKNPSRKVVTRDGRNVRIICTDVKGSSYSVLALVDKGDYEGPTLYTKNGEYVLGTKSSYDIFFAPEKHERWINIYMSSESENDVFTGACVYKLKEDAEKVGIDNDSYITTVKIEWED